MITQLLSDDRYMVLADFEVYHQCHLRVDQTYRNAKVWYQKAILNLAAMGKFSSDRTILEYNRDIWQATPMKIAREVSAN